jgi:hypothetical protein
MRAIRFAIAALIAVALAVLPVSVPFAMQPGGKADAGMTATTASDATCPCCDATHDPAKGICTLKCCSIAVTPVEPHLPVPLGSRLDGDMLAAWFAPFTLPPDPPPPRS